MKVIKADEERRLVIPGVPGEARRPVDIDASLTGFATLRTLRIYRFDAGVVVNGHSEEDEVFVVVLSGSIEWGTGTGDEVLTEGPFTLSAANDAGGNASVAYLPPHACYRLTALGESEVAYARATPLEHRPATRMHVGEGSGAEVEVLLDERDHASLLRLRVMRVEAKSGALRVELMDDRDAECEALAHVRFAARQTVRVDGRDEAPVLLEGGDTVAIMPGERPRLEVEQGRSAFVVTVLA